MRNRIRDIFAAISIATLVFSFGCTPTAQQAPGTGTGTPTASPTTPDVDGPSACTIDAINQWIEAKRSSGPLAGQSDLYITAIPVEVTTYNEKGVEQKATYAHLQVGDQLNGNPLPTFPALNGIIQPLVKKRSGNQGPCVTAVKYVTLQTDGKTMSEDFLWSYCPVGSQVCSDGTCSQYCKDGTGGIGRQQ
jgi:hypothetical protein